MTFEEIKEEERIYDEADARWEAAKREYWRDTPPCARKSCSLFNVRHKNHCTWHNIQEECKEYIAE